MCNKSQRKTFLEFPASVGLEAMAGSGRKQAARGCSVSLKGRSHRCQVGCAGHPGDSSSCPGLQALPWTCLLFDLERAGTLWEDLWALPALAVSLLGALKVQGLLSPVAPRHFLLGWSGLSTSSSQAHSLGGRELPHPQPPPPSWMLGLEESRAVRVLVLWNYQLPHLLQCHSDVDSILHSRP